MKDLRQLYLKTGENTLITSSHEDGLIHDPYRIDYLEQHFKQIDEAIDDGVDVIGYIIWGLLILFLQEAVKWKNVMALFMQMLII